MGLLCIAVVMSRCITYCAVFSPWTIYSQVTSVQNCYLLKYLFLSADHGKTWKINDRFYSLPFNATKSAHDLVPGEVQVNI